MKYSVPHYLIEGGVSLRGIRPNQELAPAALFNEEIITISSYRPSFIKVNAFMHFSVVNW